MTGKSRESGSALWVSTSLETRGGISSMVREVRESHFWSDWNVRHIASHRDGSTMLKVFTFLGALVRFVNEMLWRRPTVVHLHMSSYGSFVRKSVLLVIGRLFRVPVIVHLHGSEFHRFHDRSPRPVKRYIRYTLESAECVVALGQTWAQRLSAIAPAATVIVIPNSVRHGEPVEQPAAGDPVTVVFLGYIGERKGTFLLLDAWAELLADTDVHAKLIVAGDGEIDRARTQVARLGIESSVDVRGWVSPEQLPALLGEAQILVLPSRNEGQPMAILEAMARGLCVVATAAGGIPELIGDRCGVLIPIDDRPALVGALRRVILDDAERKELGTNAWHRIADELDIDVITQRFDEIYRKAAQ